jgi:hypothetical protein
MRRVALLMGGLVGAAWAGPRHEYVAPAFLQQFDPAKRVATTLVGAGPMPDAIRRDGAELAGPAGDAVPGPSIGRPKTIDPDRSTVGPAQTQYHATFNPSVVPWRRDTVMNAVRGDGAYQMYVAAGRRVVVPVGPRQLTPGYEPFWAHLTVEATPKGAAIPSVGPGMRVVALEAEPPVHVRIERDGAHNYYAAVLGEAPPEVRLKLLVEVDAAYFGRPLPDNVLLNALADDPDAALPPAAAAAGREVLAVIGVRGDQSFAAGVALLVAWFRGFEEKPFEGGSADIYRDLALARTGVCRHRAFAFMITARAAGVPTRYVQNEAHAFVEVRAPDGAWRRIDLGGGVAEVTVSKGEGKRQHVPGADPFAQPDGPPAGGASAGMTVSGVDAPLKPGGAGASAGGSGAEPGAGGATGGGRGGAPKPVPLPRTLTSAEPDAVPVGRAVRLVLEGQSQQVFRGEVLPNAVRGRLTDEGGLPLADRRVQLYLLPADAGAPLLAGAGVRTGADGRFEAKVQVPRGAGTGRYRLVAASEEGDGLGAGRSDLQ